MKRWSKMAHVQKGMNELADGNKKLAEDLKLKEGDALQLVVERKNAIETVDVWRPAFHLASAKMRTICPICGNNMDNCRAFRDKIWPYYIEHEAEQHEKFDAVTKEMDKELADANNVLKDVDMYKKHDQIVNITNNIERNTHQGNPDNPSDVNA